MRDEGVDERECYDLGLHLGIAAILLPAGTYYDYGKVLAVQNSYRWVDYRGGFFVFNTCCNQNYFCNKIKHLLLHDNEHRQVAHKSPFMRA